MTKSKLAYTGERYMPQDTSSEMVIEHTQRYLFAQQFAKDKVVLDAACGEGYGTAILGEVAKEIYGIDISSEAVQEAQKKYGKENITFKTASIEKLPFEDESIDLVISFETVEHVEEHIQEKFLLEIKRVLKKDGMLIMSTPNKLIYTDKIGYANPYHIKEFYLDEFKRYLCNRFSNVKIITQYFKMGYYIQEENKRPKAYPPVLDLKDARYYIAVCSNKQFELDITGDYTKFSNENYFEVITHSYKVEQDVKKLNKDFGDFRDESSSYNAHLEKDIKILNATIDELQEEIVELKNIIIHRDNDIISLNQVIDQQSNVGKELQDLILDRDNDIAKLQTIIVDQDERIKRDQQELEKFKSHWCYKVMNKLRRQVKNK